LPKGFTCIKKITHRVVRAPHAEVKMSYRDMLISIAVWKYE
jgi:hypothetical protein